jgi:hypothetical protein
MIRSLTIGLPLGSQSQSTIESSVKHLIATSKRILDEANQSSRTIRFTLPAIGTDGEIEGSMLSTLRWVDKLANENDVRWFCMPLDFLQEGVRRERIGNSLDLISRFQNCL